MATCELCGRGIHSPPVTRKLMLQERSFCSGQCAAKFDRRLGDPWRGARPSREA